MESGNRVKPSVPVRLGFIAISTTSNCMISDTRSCKADIRVADCMVDILESATISHADIRVPDCMDDICNQLYIRYT